MNLMSKKQTGKNRAKRNRKESIGNAGGNAKGSWKRNAEALVLTPEQAMKEQRRRALNREEIDLFLTRLSAMGFLVLILFGIIFGLTPMKNNDMSPRISSGDLMLYYRLEKSYISQDVIVFRKDGEQYTGRIVAREGDTVEITEDSELKVNHSIVLENDIFYRTPQYTDGISYPVTLEENQYFVLCDYREGAKDSRYFGPVDADEIKGKVITVIRRSNL